MTADETPNDLLTAALGYAARGWRVVPLHQFDVRGCSCGSGECKSPGKHPRTKHGLKDATTDAGQIREWWGRWPRANVAVVCGKESGVWMVGPDGERGLADLAALEQQHGELPATLRSRSGGGGAHLIFRYPADGGFVTNRKNHRGTKIDVRAEGEMGCGYFVAPPSRTDKGVYQWTTDHEPAEALPWVVEWARTDEVKERPAEPPPRPMPTPAEPDRAAVHKRAVGYLNTIPDAVQGEGGSDPTFWAARVLVHGYLLSQEEAFAILATFFNPRCKPNWSEKELRYKVKEAAERPFNKPKGWLLASANPYAEFPMPRANPTAGVEQLGPPPRPWEQKLAVGQGPTGMTAVALADKEFPPPKWAIEGLLPEGLTVLVGAPKAGKSWLSLLVGWAVAAGGQLDGRPVTGGEVLYLALEDTFRRLQSRLFTLRKGVEYPIPERLTLAINWPRADAEGLQHIAEWIEARKDTARLVIVDTLAMFRKVQSGKGNSYAEDYEAVGGLKKLLDHYGVSGMINHHTRKMKSADPFDDISGTQGIAGSADSMWVLEGGTNRTAQLFMKGRDLPEGTTPLTFNKEHCRWLLGPTLDGIHADGRGDTPATTRAKACESWLREFLQEFARPSAVIEQAAKDAGFSFSQLREAKARLGRNGTGEVVHQNFGKSGEKAWWSGIGPAGSWKFPPDGPRPPGMWAGKANHRRDTDGPEGDDEEGF